MSLMLLNSCSSNNEDDMETPTSTNTLKVIPLSSSFVDANPMTRAFLPDDYINYTLLDGKTNPQYANIGMFMTPVRKTPTVDYIYQNINPETGLGTDEWASTISVLDGTSYYMYGFMPGTAAGNASIEPLNSDYANGATLTINGFDTLTPADVCMVVGVRKATAEEEAVHEPKEDVKLGSFSYIGGTENNNSVFVLLKHIYSGLRFKIHIDPEYHKLRTIKVTKVELEAEDITETVNLSMTVTANSTGADPLTNVTYTPSSSTSNCIITLYPWTGSSTEFEVPEAVPEVFLACFAPASCSSFILKSTYNVYDRKGNLIRQGCTAENKLNSDVLTGLNSVQAGDIFNIDLLLKPTYLYVLSEPDLDNPTFDLTMN